MSLQTNKGDLDRFYFYEQMGSNVCCVPTLLLWGVDKRRMVLLRVPCIHQHGASCCRERAITCLVRKPSLQRGSGLLGESRCIALEGQRAGTSCQAFMGTLDAPSSVAPGWLQASSSSAKLWV